MVVIDVKRKSYTRKMTTPPRLRKKMRTTATFPGQGEFLNLSLDDLKEMSRNGELAGFGTFDHTRFFTRKEHKLAYVRKNLNAKFAEAFDTPCDPVCDLTKHFYNARKNPRYLRLWNLFIKSSAIVKFENCGLDRVVTAFWNLIGM
jgi:hypothetical protein